MSGSQRDKDEVEDNAPTSLFTMENWKVAQVNIVSGTLNGYSIGFVAVYTDLYGMSTKCDSYKSAAPCDTLSNSKCHWNTTTLACNWNNKPVCADIKLENDCKAKSQCEWSYSGKKCQNPSGYSSTDSGIFAGAMIVGCMIGSIFAGPIAKRLGPKLSFFVVGLVALISSVAYHIATAANQFWVLCAARLLVGLVLGLVCVAAPMYVAENASTKYSKMIGVLFQVFVTLGICLAALIGLIVGQSVNFKSSGNQHLSARMQVICAFSTLLSVLMMLLGIFLKRSNSSNDYEEEDNNEVSQGGERLYSYSEMVGPIIMGFVVAGTLQMTGINAIMNYAPTIMSNLGLTPLVGNFIVMLWNFVTTIASIPLASVFTMRQLFLAGSIITSLCCLLLCGIPVYPGVASDNVRNGVAITGIMIFIAAFETGVGPCFYVLAQDLFPPSFRPKGSSATMLAQFIFNVIINIGYPIATKALSGGASGNQNKGQAIAFIFFGCIGTLCFILQIFFLHPWESSSNTKNKYEDTDA